MRARLARRTVLAAAALLLPRAVRAGDAAVAIKDFAFDPATLTVPAGTKVVWTNRDDTPHKLASNAQPPLFVSDALDSDDAWPMVFDKPGTYGYFCTLHPHMQGAVIVT